MILRWGMWFGTTKCRVNWLVSWFIYKLILLVYRWDWKVKLNQRINDRERVHGCFYWHLLRERERERNEQSKPQDRLHFLPIKMLFEFLFFVSVSPLLLCCNCCCLFGAAREPLSFCLCAIVKLFLLRWRVVSDCASKNSISCKIYFTLLTFVQLPAYSTTYLPWIIAVQLYI